MCWGPGNQNGQTCQTRSVSVDCAAGPQQTMSTQRTESGSDRPLPANCIRPLLLLQGGVCRPVQYHPLSMANIASVDCSKQTEMRVRLAQRSSISKVDSLTAQHVEYDQRHTPKHCWVAQRLCSGIAWPWNTHQCSRSHCKHVATRFLRAAGLFACCHRTSCKNLHKAITC